MNIGMIDASIQAENRTKRGVALHEAGHFAVARSVGFQVLGLKVSRDRPRSEYHSGSAHISIISPIADDRELENYLRARIMVLLAGGLAQAFDGATWDERRLCQIRADNASDDMSKARELFALHLNRRIALGEDLAYAESNKWESHPFWQQCEEESRTTLKNQWEAIRRISDDIETEVHRDCYNYDPPIERILAIGWPNEGTLTG